MSNAHNNVYESASSNITVWQSIDWNKVEQYVGKQQKRIYKAGLREPSVLKGTRWVLGRVWGSNFPFLSDK